jgi:hypothetical protein
MRTPRLLLVVALVVGAVGMWRVGAAQAGVAPRKVGYWMRSQQSLPAPPVGLDPRVDPLVPRYVPQLPAPFVPAGGLYVANSADTNQTVEDGPTAVSGLTYKVNGVVSATLELRVFSITGPPPKPWESLPTKLSTEPPPPPSPNSLIFLAACPVDAEWLSPPGGGPGRWDDRPRYDLGRCVLGQWSVDGSKLFFDLGRDRQFSEGVFDLAIVPDPAHAVQPLNTTAPDPSDTNEVAGKVNEVRNQATRTNPTFSVVFDPPRAESLTPGDPDDPDPPEVPEEPEPSEEPSVDESSSEEIVEEFAAVDPSVLIDYNDPSVILNGPAPVVPKPGRVSRRLGPSGGIENAAAVASTRGSRIMAAMLLSALMAAWWWVAGQPMPKLALLGPLARKEEDEPVMPSETNDGIGRFVRPRGDRPRPLL